MKKIKMNWVQTPYLRNGSVGVYAKLAFDCFVSSEMFEVVKGSFNGYINKNGKKTAVYDVHVINSLMNNGFNIQLDGVDIKKSEHYHCEILIQQSGNSTNERIKFLHNLYSQVLKEKNREIDFHKELDELFDNKKHMITKKSEPADIKWETIKVGHIDLYFDYKYGVEKRITFEETSHEHFVGVNVYRSINLEKISQLKELIESAKNYKPLIYDENYQWQPGFDETTYEAKKKKSYGF